ncbi:MAG: efflux RND transporter periplasmic adaptor subunit, partial [Gammaproteobacteria bacterium]
MSKRAGSASAGIFSNSSFWLAAVLSVLLFSWIMYGAVSKAEQIQPESNAESNTEKEKTPVSVASVIVRRSVATKIWPNICISAKSEPSRRAEIMAETHGQVKEILFNKGDYVKKGDALLKLDMLDRAQRKKEIQALIEQSKLEYKVAKKLYTKKFSTETRLAAAKTSLAGARARLKQIEIEIKNTIVRAPFDGFINAQMVEVGDYVTTGRSVVSIVDINPVIFSGDIVEQDIASIKNGAQVVATLLNGKQVSGKISFISPLAKNATRTFRIEVESENKDFSISGGLSAQMCIKT